MPDEEQEGYTFTKSLANQILSNVCHYHVHA